MIKDDITQENWPEMLQDMINMTVHIDNWQHEWHMKWKEIIELIMIRKKEKNYHHSGHYRGYNLQLMNFDAIIRQLSWHKSNEYFSKNQKLREEWYNFSTKRHFTWDC